MNFLPIFAFLILLFKISSFTQLSQTNSDIININSMIDESWLDIQRAIIRFGFDPMKIPNISDYVSTATINLTNGVITGAGGMVRAGDFYLSFHPYTTRLHARVHFKELKGKFNYSLNALIIYYDNGIMDATMENITASMSIDYRLDTFTLLNPKLQIESYDNIYVTTDSDSFVIAKWIKNMIANVITPYYQDHILRISENTALIVADDVIRYANKHLTQWIADGIYRIIFGGANRSVV